MDRLARLPQASGRYQLETRSFGIEALSLDTLDLESQWPRIMGYFGSFMGYFGVQWHIILGYLAFQGGPIYMRWKEPQLRLGFQRTQTWGLAFLGVTSRD